MNSIQPEIHYHMGWHSRHTVLYKNSTSTCLQVITSSRHVQQSTRIFLPATAHKFTAVNFLNIALSPSFLQPLKCFLLRKKIRNGFYANHTCGSLLDSSQVTQVREDDGAAGTQGWVGIPDCSGTRSSRIDVYAGYLRKKSRQDRWQRRYFEATTHYLTYYKVELWQSGVQVDEQLADWSWMSVCTYMGVWL